MLLRQATHSSEAQAALPAELKAEGHGKKRRVEHKGKESQAAAQSAPHLSHAELMSQIRQADEPLSVGGESLHFLQGVHDTQARVNETCFSEYMVMSVHVRGNLTIKYPNCLPSTVKPNTYEHKHPSKQQEVLQCVKYYFVTFAAHGIGMHRFHVCRLGTPKPQHILTSINSRRASTGCSTSSCCSDAA